MRARKNEIKPETYVKDSFNGIRWMKWGEKPAEGFLTALNADILEAIDQGTIKHEGHVASFSSKKPR